ncbi:regulatory protein GntR, HTH [Halanaerobium saccharolyticum subsp. saccharolyticum DSM 6643]|uniref:Regulatory protein GntR, HTH n=1 Tax=Halanaerobium saccharolyticum subsp. saccharolyticum DSM 6643 TaxID=1293054 RepID=M5E321_9FIRM|nr:GntR family transcriptional regulator [Halanaerobium saccharolyticum]CCU80924.1 regulatory protein GntR, HTH [Halanaerobium saccharolyticum subsp. saccharolyticum DSM 6643]
MLIKITDHKKENMNMKNYIYNILKENILYFNLKPGKKLKKSVFIKEFNVSRTPIREAFAKLEEEKLINIYPQRGTFVSLIDINSVENFKFVREKLEISNLIKSCEMLNQKDILELQTNIEMQEICLKRDDHVCFYKYDNEFHKMLFNCSGRADVWETINKSSMDLNRMRILSLYTNFNRPDVLSDHKEILEAVKSRNIKNSEKAMKAHMDRIVFDTEKMVNDYKNYFKLNKSG